MAVTYHIDDGKFGRWNELHRLLMDSFAYMAPRIDPPSSLLRMGPEELARKAESEKLVLATDGGRIVGCVFLRREADAIYVGKMAVDARYRGQGISRTFVRIAEKIAKDAGLAWLELQTRVELQENHETFSRLGFVKTGETSHEGYDRTTTFTMRKRIESLKAVP